MTRRDFQLIARVFSENRAPRPLVEAMADELRGTNPRFDRERFVRASAARGPEPGRMMPAAWTGLVASRDSPALEDADPAGIE